MRSAGCGSTAESCSKFIVPDLAPFPWRERAKFDRAKRHAMQPRDLMARRREQPPHLPVLALVQVDDKMTLAA
jgi:hypothetical protein